jgi:outer membrane usher protein
MARLILLLLLGLALWTALASAAFAQDRALATISTYAVTLNGHDTGETMDFTVGDQGLELTPVDLRRLGLIVKPGPDLLPLNHVPGLSYSIDERNQTVLIKADRQAMRAAMIDMARPPDAGPLQSSQGALANYDVTASTVGGHATLAGEVEARAFGKWGVIDATALVSSTGAGARPLDVAWSYADVGAMRRYTVGNLINSALTWTRPVRMLGAQVSSDFTLRPDLVTFPTPTLKGDAAATSTIDVFVNGEQKYTGQANGGAFDVASVPVVSGLNQVSMAVTDASGRRTVETLPFYASPVMLEPGLATFSLEAGALRSGYGGPGDHYGAGAASASARFGLTQTLTAEAHAEMARGLLELGGGSDFTTPLGLVSLAGAGSFGPGRSGGYGGVSFERTTRGFSVSAGLEGTFGDYSDLAGLQGDVAPRARARVQIGWPIGDSSAINLAYIRQITNGPGGADTGALAATYSRQIRRGLNLSANAYVNTSQRRGRSFFLTLTAVFGRVSSAVGAVVSDTGTSALVQAAKPATGPDDPNEWRFAAQSGVQGQVLGEVGRRTSVGEFTAGLDWLGGQASARVTATGSIVAMDNHIFFAKTIDNSFAIVHLDVPGVTVLADNRPLGRTNASGVLLAPDLRAFQPNVLAVDPTDVPLQMTLQATALTVKPQDRVGVVVRFPVKVESEALVLLNDEIGAVIPVGAAVYQNGGDEAEVGFEGQVFLKNLKPHNALTVRKASGEVCKAHFDYVPARDRVARIGPIRCLKEAGA